MAEWLKAHAWKACVRETVPWVRIPLSPPVLTRKPFKILRKTARKPLQTGAYCPFRVIQVISPDYLREQSQPSPRSNPKGRRDRFGRKDGRMAGVAGRRVGRLTVRQVEAENEPGLHGDGGNLFLKVGEVGGSKSWMFRHQVDGKVKKYGLGPFPTISLADARQRAEVIRRQLLDGIDPREARRVEQEAAAVAQPSRSASMMRPPPTSRAIRPDGKATSTLRNGRRPSRPMPARYSVDCR